jgi:hypothetical protein
MNDIPLRPRDGPGVVNTSHGTCLSHERRTSGNPGHVGRFTRSRRSPGKRSAPGAFAAVAQSLILQLGH